MYRLMKTSHNSFVGRTLVPPARTQIECAAVSVAEMTRMLEEETMAVHRYVARRSRHHTQRGVYRLRKLVPPSLSCQPTTPPRCSLPAHAAAARR